MSIKVNQIGTVPYLSDLFQTPPMEFKGLGDVCKQLFEVRDELLDLFIFRVAGGFELRRVNEGGTKSAIESPTTSVYLRLAASRDGNGAKHHYTNAETDELYKIGSAESHYVYNLIDHMASSLLVGTGIYLSQTTSQVLLLDSDDVIALELDTPSASDLVLSFSGSVKGEPFI